MVSPLHVRLMYPTPAVIGSPAATGFTLVDDADSGPVQVPDGSVQLQHQAVCIIL